MPDINISFPVLRFGKIIKPKTTGPLSAEQALSVAEQIKSHTDDFLEVFRLCISKSDGSFSVLEGESTVIESNENTPIVRFPKFHISTPPWQCAGSVSLTVCCGEKRSKIWTRTSLRSIDDRPALGLDYDASQDYFKKSLPLMECLASSVRNKYEGIIKGMGLADMLEEQYQFNIYGINSSDYRLFETLEKISVRQVTTLEETLRKFPESKEAYIPLFMLASGKHLTDSADMIKYARRPFTAMRFVESKEDARNFSSVSITHTEKDEALINCLCYADISHPISYSPADMATARLLDNFARAL